MPYNNSYANQLYLNSVNASYNSSGIFVGTNTNEYNTYQSYINTHQQDPDYKPVVVIDGAFEAPASDWFDAAFGPGTVTYPFNVSSNVSAINEGNEVLIDINLTNKNYNKAGVYYTLSGPNGIHSGFGEQDYEPIPSPMDRRTMEGLISWISFKNTDNYQLKVNIKADEIRRHALYSRAL